VRAVIRLSDQARAALRPGEVLVVDWHRVALCCAAAGEVSLHPVPRVRAAGRTFRPVACDPPGAVLVHERALPHLRDRDVTVDCGTRLGLRTFRCDLPTDFGLRATLGRLPGSP
jgi:hypothetical protein